MTVIVLLGPPGAGKGTTARGLAERSGYRHLSTGEVLRKAMREGTEVGQAITPFMDAGQLVPDELVMQIVEEELEQGGNDEVFVLDGVPRTLPQAEMLDRFLEQQGWGQLRHVFLFEVDREILVRRLLGRLTCLNCRSIFHLDSKPPKVAMVCDACGSPLHQRDDDVEKTIQERMAVYRRQTEPLVAYYRQRGVLVPIRATGQVGETEEQILQRLGTGEWSDESK